MKHTTALFSLLLFCTMICHSQNLTVVNSLKKELAKKDLPDSARISRYISIVEQYSSTEKDSALVYANKAEIMAFSTNNMQGYARALYSKATIYYYLNDYKTAKIYQLRSLKEARKLKDKRLMAKNYNLLGAMYYNEGNYESATNYYNQKLQLCIELKDTSSVIESYYNMSLLLNEKGEYKKAIEYNFLALTMAEASKDSAAILYSSQGLAIAFRSLSDFKNAKIYLANAKKIAEILNDSYSLSGILIDEGSRYNDINKLDSAIFSFQKALDISKKIKDDYHYTKALNSISLPYIRKKEFEKAISYLKESEAINTPLGYKAGLATGYNALFECYYSIGDFKQAFNYAQKGEVLAKETSSKTDLMNVYHNLYIINEKFNNTDKALFYLKKYTAIKDDIDASKQLIEVAKQEMKSEKAKQDKIRMQEKILAQARFEKQKQIQNIILIASTILLILLLFLFRNYRQKQKANVEISEQKKIIEHKNKDILDSINYSKRIQQAILTPVEEVKKLLPESFILFKPKDIVSGDFYFIEPIDARDGDEWIAVAMADCTGHGVPGAFMSIMGYNFLKQSLKVKEIMGPGQALDFTSKELYSFLRFNLKEGNIRDGMDVAFCALNKTKNLLTFAGANNPLWIISKRNNIENSNGESLKIIKTQGDYHLYEVKANKQHVGYNERRDLFTTHTIHLMKDDLVYLFTDGYADQFGGPKGKKFKYQQLSQILLDHAHVPMEQQHLELEKAFMNWIGDLEQIDDVSLMGIKI